MRLVRPERRMTGEPVIALIDVTFFLLVFALLTGRMDATAPFEVTPPQALTGDDLEQGGITLAVDQGGRLALDGAEVAREALPGLVAEKLASAERTALFRINADAGASLRDLLVILGEVEAAGARRVVFVVTPQPP